MFRYADINGKSSRNIGIKRHENVFTLDGKCVSLLRIRTLSLLTLLMNHQMMEVLIKRSSKKFMISSKEAFQKVLPITISTLNDIHEAFMCCNYIRYRFKTFSRLFCKKYHCFKLAFQNFYLKWYMKHPCVATIFHNTCEHTHI